jgi:hypothetical protein
MTFQFLEIFKEFLGLILAKKCCDIRKLRREREIVNDFAMDTGGGGEGVQSQNEEASYEGWKTMIVVAEDNNEASNQDARTQREDKDEGGGAAVEPISNNNTKKKKKNKVKVRGELHLSTMIEVEMFGEDGKDLQRKKRTVKSILMEEESFLWASLSNFEKEKEGLPAEEKRENQVQHPQPKSDNNEEINKVKQSKNKESIETTEEQQQTKNSDTPPMSWRDCTTLNSRKKGAVLPQNPNGSLIKPFSPLLATARTSASINSPNAATVPSPQKPGPLLPRSPTPGPREALTGSDQALTRKKTPPPPPPRPRAGGISE